MAVAELEKKKEEQSKLESHLSQELERLRALPVEMQIQSNIRQISINFRETMRTKIAEAKAKVLEAQHEVIREQRKVVEKRKRKLVMEKLREKEEEQYYEELRRKEVSDMDEVSSNLWSHRELAD